MRKKKCKTCKETFQPVRQFQEACSVPCAVELSKLKLIKKQEREKRERKREDKKKLQDFKPIRHWLSKTQAVFNEYIRLRDKNESCISCDRPPHGDDYLTGSVWDCGHYRSIGSAAHLRFDPRNAHKQCVKCNRDLSGNTVEYRSRLVKKLGKEAVEKLESEYFVRKWTREELEAMRRAYRLKIKDLKQDMAA